MKKWIAVLENELNGILVYHKDPEPDFIAYVEMKDGVKEVVSRTDGKLEVTCTFAVVAFEDGKQDNAAQRLHDEAFERNPRQNDTI